MIEESTTLETAPLPIGKQSKLRAGGGDTAEGRRQSRPSGKLAGAMSKTLGSVSTWGFVDQGVVSIASFSAAAIVGRWCGEEELGIYYLAVKIFWLVAGIPNALVWMPYTARAPRMSAERQRFFLGSATTHMLLIAAAISLALLAAGLVPLLGLSDKLWLWPMCVALVPFSILMMLREHLRRVLLAHMNTTGLLRVDVPIALLQLGILGSLAWSGRLTAVTALLGMAAGCVWGVLWVLWHRDRFRVERRRIEAHWGHNLQFGKWLLVVSIAWLLAEASYFWLVEAFHGLTVLGQFSAAAITVMLFNPIMLTVQNLARSILSNSYAQGGKESLWDKTVQGTIWVAIGFGAAFLLVAVAGEQLVTLFFGDKFTGLGLVVASLCLGMYAHVLCSPVEGALTAMKDGRAMLWASLLRLAMTLLAGVPLIALYGPIGVGFAMATGALASAGYEWMVFRGRHRHASS